MSKRKSRLLYQPEQKVENNIVSINTYYNTKKRAVQLLPKTLNQETYINLLTDTNKLIIFATGPAGTGKTMLAVMAAIQALQRGECKRIVITRPAVGVDDEEHGFLPGDLNAKMAPWTRPIMDVFAEYYRQSEIAKMLDEQTIEISPLAFMRGRTFKNSWIIADEMQNATPSQMKMLLTRIGEGSKIIVTGDTQQADRKAQIKQASTGATRGSGEPQSKKIYRRSDIVDLMRKDPDRYMALQPEIMAAYAEGRVK